jgi:hypothetical protein
MVSFGISGVEPSDFVIILILFLFLLLINLMIDKRQNVYAVLAEYLLFRIHFAPPLSEPFVGIFHATASLYF